MNQQNDENIEQGDVVFEETNTTPSEDREVEMDDIVETDESGDEQTLVQKNKSLKEKIKALEAERKEYLDGWQRAKADAINQKKDFEIKQKELISYANKKLLAELIPVMDSFLMAMKNKEVWESVDKNWRIGVEYIRTQLEGLLNKEGVVLYGSIGDKADPNLFSALDTVATDDISKDGTVAEILQYGFKMQDKVLREAKVKVYAHGKTE